MMFSCLLEGTFCNTFLIRTFFLFPPGCSWLSPLLHPATKVRILFSDCNMMHVVSANIILTLSFPHAHRNSSTKDLTFFAGKAFAMNRQLAEQDDLEEQQQQDSPQVVTIGASSMRLSPPSNSKLAKRRQRSSMLKGAPVSASELRQLLAPLVIVGDCAWLVELGYLYGQTNDWVFSTFTPLFVPWSNWNQTLS